MHVYTYTYGTGAQDPLPSCAVHGGGHIGCAWRRTYHGGGHIGCRVYYTFLDDNIKPHFDGNRFLGGHVWFQHRYGFAHSISRIKPYQCVGVVALYPDDNVCVCVGGGGGGSREAGSSARQSIIYGWLINLAERYRTVNKDLELAMLKASWLVSGHHVWCDGTAQLC